MLPLLMAMFSPFTFMRKEKNDTTAILPSVMYHISMKVLGHLSELSETQQYLLISYIIIILV